MDGEYKIGDIVLGNWMLNRLIGEGSYGKVYEASREDFGVTYKAAIKIITIPQNKSEIKSVMSEGMDEKSVTDYFRTMVEEIVREFSLMSRLKGTANVVSYEDHAVIPHKNAVGWDIIIRMELLTPLLDYLNSVASTCEDIVKLGIDLCRALELCQRFNIVHRDIKPENIFVSEIGDYKLGDFGIARTVDKTTSGLSKKGTYTYMAPEVYKENAYGPSVDIYSLGLVLYRLLNDNRAPFLPQYPDPITFEAREAALSKRMAGELLPTPRHANEQMAKIICKACAYDPKKRYSSPIEMREALEAVLHGREESPKISSIGEIVPATKHSLTTSGVVELTEEKTESLFRHRTAPTVSQERVKAADPFRFRSAGEWTAPDVTESIFSPHGASGSSNQKEEIELEDEIKLEKIIKTNNVIIWGLLVVATVLIGMIIMPYFTSNHTGYILGNKNENGFEHTENYEEEDFEATEENTAYVTSFTVTRRKVNALELQLNAHGPVPKSWNISYSIEGQKPKIKEVVGNNFVLSDLQADTLYTINVEPSDGYNISGSTAVTGKTLTAVNIGELNVETSGSVANLTWTFTGATPESWNVTTTGTDDYSDSQTVSQSAVVLENLRAGETYSILITCDNMEQAVSTSITPNTLKIMNLKAEAAEDGSIAVTWDTEAEDDEIKWLVVSNMKGTDTMTSAQQTMETAVNLTGLIPNSTYVIEVQEANGKQVGGDSTKVEITIPAAEKFSDYGFTSGYVSTWLRPAKDEWTVNDLGTLRNSFSASEKIAFACESINAPKDSDETVFILLVVRNADGSVVDYYAGEEVWGDMWTQNKYVGELLRTPVKTGTYTLEIYFNGKLATSGTPATFVIK